MNAEIGFEGMQDLFSDDYHVCGLTYENDKIIIHIKSQKTEAVCPDCGETSTSIHSTYSREIQDTPIRNIQTWLRTSVHKFDCLNPNCEAKVFTEAIDFAGHYQVRTYELTLMALETARNLGNETASQVLASFGVKLSNDTITRIYKGLDFEDDPFVEEIGIDDVSNKKGQSYFTVIYELNTHRLLALLEGRDGEALKQWLRGHMKVRLVARDRASAYASAISEILPDAVQVADRFHLLQNMLDRARDIIKTIIPDKIFFAGSEVIEKQPKKETAVQAVDLELLSQMDYDNSPPLDEDGREIQFDSKNRNPDSPQYKAQAESRKVKQQLIRDIQKYKHDNPAATKKELADIFGITGFTVKKYLRMSTQEIDEMDSPKEYKKREKIVDDYSNIIFKMLLDYVSTEIIYAYVCHCGFSGNPTTMISYIERVKKNNFPEQKVLHPMKIVETHYPEGAGEVSRGSLLKYEVTCNPKTPLDPEVGKVIDSAKKRYPVLDVVGKAFRSFHSILMGNSPDALDGFLKEYENSEFKSFCDGIRRDIAPVKYAISLPVSSGFVEGCNNKFKLLKRSLYGRSKFVNLYKKCMLAFAPNDPSFNLRALLLN